jgi:1,4-alpha-glucan branching enzyme
MAKTTANKVAKAPAKKAAAKPAAEKKACAKACAKPAAKKAAPKAAAKPAAEKKAAPKAAAAKKVAVEFVADCPLATTVSVAGSFNNWAVDKDMLKKDKKTGLWTAKISLSAGDYEYKFVCDGKNWDAGDNKIKHV